MPASRRSSVVLKCSIGVHLIAAIALASICVATPSPAQAQHVQAVVNGVPITSFDVEQRSRLIQMSTNKAPNRKEVLEELIDEKVKLNEAKKFGLEVSNAEVDSTLAGMASRLGMKPAQLVQALSGRGVHIETLKSRIRADTVWGNLVRGRYQATLEVGSGDVRAALGPASQESAIGHVYTLRPILFIVPQGSPAGAFEARKREAEALRSRVSNCEQGVRSARELRDVAVRDTIIRDSASLPAPLRTMLNGLQIGQLTAPETTAQGVELFALCAREETKAETPRAHEAKQKIFSKRFEAQSKRYLKQIRRSAMIEYK